MFSHHPFTLHHRYSLDAAPSLPLWKRGFDLVCCVAALPFLGLLTLVFALIAKASSPGPVLYRQRHVGAMGRVFGVYRFRTMRLATGDSTATGMMLLGGRLLRASGLADLPQIVNVLRGEMSFVGPRPSPDLVERSRESAHTLHAVPGITGAWRLKGSNAGESVRWEQRYADHMSLGGDLVIIVRTLVAALFLRGGR